MGNEEFRPVEGNPRYRVSNMGRVESYTKGAWREMNYNLCAGYKRVWLILDGDHRAYRVSRLVAQAFIPNPGNLPLVRHLNGIISENISSNLAWGTYADNAADKKGHPKWVASRLSNRSMSPEVVAEARRLRWLGLKKKTIARMFGVPYGTMIHMLNGWTYIHEPEAKSEENRIHELEKELNQVVNQLLDLKDIRGKE